jgi:hypothetical protein
MPINALLYQVYLQEMHLSMSGEDNEKGYAFLTSSKDETTKYEHNQNCKETKRVSNDHVP